jgi:uncharacterized membrane protein YgcG
MMKRLIPWLLFGVAVLWPSRSMAQEAWVIHRFNGDIAIQMDGSVVVKETIDVDFQGIEKHGIYRDIPYVYQSESGKPLYTRISDIVVTQDGGKAQVEVTRNEANTRIRIGNPDATISGRHTYDISYRVWGVLQSFGTFDELNWNVTGNAWVVPIESAAATVTVPATIVQIACYQGAFGSQESCPSAQKVSDRVARFEAGLLPAGEGLTAAVGFTAGVVPIVAVEAPPTVNNVIFSPITGVAALLVVVAGLGFLLWRWYRFGRDRYWPRVPLPGERSDREGKKLPEKILPLGYRLPVSVEYEPPDRLRPAEIGVLMDERADTLDVVATIVDLAVRGYLTITEIPKAWLFGKRDYELIRTQKEAAGLLEYEKVFLEKLFEDKKSVVLSSLKNSFYKNLQKVKELLYEEVVRKQLFDRSPDKVRIIYGGVSVAAMIGGGMLGWGVVQLVHQASRLAISHQLLAGLAGGLFVGGLLGLLFSPLMPRKTGYGRELYDRVWGYQLFVSGTEKYRAKFYENEGLFMEVLPYAIVFGVTKKLAKAFETMGIQTPTPAWFQGVGTFNAVNFVSNIDSFSHSLSRAMISSPSRSGSGGGGFSGGGFGGGGGGSW